MKIKGRYSRYMFFKKMYKRHIILIKGKDRYYTYDRDKEILGYVKFKNKYSECNLSYLDKYNINYLVIEDLDIIDNVKFNNNNYMKYYKLFHLKNILIKIGNI